MIPLLLFAAIAVALPLHGQPRDGGGTSLICELRGPDSIRFVDDRYVPEQFRLEVTLWNPGVDTITDVTVYLLSTGRFRLISSAALLVDSILPGETRTLAGDATFLLQPLPTDQSLHDTITVFVDTRGNQSECIHVVFLEKERKPGLALVCESPPALQFDEAANRYVPDPFPVRLILRNVGDAVAEDCRIDFLGPSRVIPFDGSGSREVGALAPGEEFEVVWLMTPERRDAGSTERLLFEAQGRGGLGARTVTAPCASELFIPAARTRQYVCAIDIDTVSYDPVGGRYIPDPVLLRVTVTNVGQGIGSGMSMHTVLEEGLLLAPGQSADDTLHRTLEPGSMAGPFVKSIRPLQTATGDSLTVTVIFRDAFGNGTTCEHVIWIPPADATTLSLFCNSDRDSITVDARTGGYEQSTIRLDAEIENTGSLPMYNVSLFAFPDPDGVLLIDPAGREIQVATVLSPGDGRQRASWNVRTRATDIASTVRLRVLGIARNADGQYLPLAFCEVPVFVPGVGQPRLECAMSTDVTDGGADMTVDFDTLRSEYEGVPSRFGAYSVFRIDARIENSGNAIASPVNAVLLLPPPLQFEEGQSETKLVQPAEIPIGGHATVSWLVRPFAVGKDSLLSVELLTTATQAQPVRCTMPLRLAEALDVVRISVPQNLTGVEGSTLDVPVTISPTPGLEPRAYQFMLRFDPEILHFVEAQAGATLTESNWRNLRATLYRERGQSALNIIHVTDSTRFTPQPREAEAALVRLRFHVRERGASPDDPAYIVRSPLSFLPYPSVMGDGTLLRPFVLPFDTSGQRRLIPVFSDGEATLTGECVLPLSASTRLFPNRPNPFNPVTRIPFFLAEASAYRIVLHDAFGRPLRLIAEGSGEAGMHQVLLDAGDLPSGVYFCVLEAGSVRQQRRMLLVK